jgi:putative Mn2+ efflux pump MntP
MLISSISFLFTVFGIHLGKAFSSLLGKKAEVLGGLILIMIGLRITLGAML